MDYFFADELHTAAIAAKIRVWAELGLGVDSSGFERKRKGYLINKQFLYELNSLNSL